MTNDAEDAIDLTRFIDRIARVRYETYDSHYSMAGGLSWEEYKADDPDGAQGLYLNDARREVLRALPYLDLRPVRAAAWDEGMRAGADLGISIGERVLHIRDGWPEPPPNPYRAAS